jgi:hypothetical protein
MISSSQNARELSASQLEIAKLAKVGVFLPSVVEVLRLERCYQ